jgi:uncharacterized protein (TIGR03790 family)
MLIHTLRTLVVLILMAPSAAAGSDGRSVLVVINDNSSLSRTIGDYYARRRSIPESNLCRIHATEEEIVSRDQYNVQVAGAIAGCLRKARLVEQVLYIVTTMGVPLRISGSEGMNGDQASVDSELTLLYLDMKTGKPHPVKGTLLNPFYRKKDEAFAHPQFPMYLVTRLAAYDFEGVKAIIDRSLQAANRGKFVIDERAAGEDAGGDDWLRKAAALLPADRVVHDTTIKVLYDLTDVIGYASWGSNDFNRHRRFLGFHWLPGAVATEFVSTNARTFQKPPDAWTIGEWKTRAGWFFGSPQTMTADYLLEGATAATGHVDEPFLFANPHPELLLPAYYSGRNLAESYYLSILPLSWQNVIIGDPLCSLGKP